MVGPRDSNLRTASVDQPARWKSSDGIGTLPPMQQGTPRRGAAKVARGALRQSDKVLRAAADLSKGRCDHVFTIEELTVAAWRRFQPLFGLRGFERTHPDHKAVCNAVMGRSRLAARGLLEHVEASTYRLTRDGLARLRAVGLF